MEIGDATPRCEKCNSTQTYVRRITNERVCRICGNVQHLDSGLANLEVTE